MGLWAKAMSGFKRSLPSQTMVVKNSSEIDTTGQNSPPDELDADIAEGAFSSTLEYNDFERK